MKLLDKKFDKTINFFSKSSISSIKKINIEPYTVAVICSSKIVFISGKERKVKISIRSSKEVFLNGSFRPSDGKIFAISGKNKKIDLLDIENNCLLRTFLAHKSAIYDLELSFDNAQFISGGDDKTLKLWDITSQKCLFSFGYHKNFVRSVSYFPGHNQICGSSSFDGKIRMFDLRCYKSLVSVFEHGCPVEAFRFLPNGKNLTSLGGNYLKIWSNISKAEILTIKESKPLITFEPVYDKALYYSDLNCEFKKFDFLRNQLSSVFSFQTDVISIASFPLGLVIGLSNGKVCFKKYVKKNYNANALLSRLEKKNFHENPFNADFCSNFFYFPQKKKNMFTKEDSTENSFGKKKKKSKKIFSLNIVKKKRLDQTWVKNQTSSFIKNGLNTSRGLFLSLIVFEKLHKKIDLEKVLSRISSIYFFSIFDFIKKNVFRISVVNNLKYLKQISKFYLSVIGSRILFYNGLNFFLSINKKMSCFEEENFLGNWLDYTFFFD